MPADRDIDIRNAGFFTSLWGYSKREVDSHLDAVAEAYRELEAELADSRRQVAQLVAQAPLSPSQPA